MNNLTQYESYFRDEIVTKYQRINGFYHIDMFEFDSFVRDLRGKKYEVPLLVLEPYTTGTIANYNDNICDAISGALVILGQYDPRTGKDEESKTAFLTSMEEITRQIKNKMIADKKIPYHPIRGLILPSISMAKTEVIANTFQGYRLSFSIETKADMELKTDDWIL